MGLQSIRRIYNHLTESNRKVLNQCKLILLSQFPYLSKSEADAILHDAGNSSHPDFSYLVIVAEGRNQQVLGVAIASHFRKENFIFLDYIATRQHRISGGIGGALYERLRDEAAAIGTVGVFFDCLPDEKELCTDATERKQNSARLKFYERFGARPIINTKYEMPRKDHSVFHLVYDTLAETKSLKKQEARNIITSILQNKAAKKCSEKYIQEVEESITKDVQLRSFQYFAVEEVHAEIHDSIPLDKKIGLIVNEGHLIHHVRERGYLESPVRVTSILKELNKTPYFETSKANKFSDQHLAEVHDKNYLKFLKKICELIGTTATRYGDVFPIRNASRLPKDVELQIGYYCIDTSTPLNANAYIAARAAVDCALTAANQVLNGKQFSYALVRPPGHHAEGKYFGGFCYLNSNAVAAHYLSKKGKVAILDIDYHHGNGQQDIFYQRKDVFTVSIHADPEYAYPNFTGFEDEVGEGKGKGYNLNITLPQGVTGKEYRKSLSKALEVIKDFNPTYLVLALGLDIAKGDPTGTWLLSADDFTENGKMIAGVGIPTVVIQEGGYQNKVLGSNARHFFKGLWEGYYGK